MQSLRSAEDSIERLTATIEDLPVLRADEVIQPLIQELALSAQMERAVQKAEQAPEDSRDVRLPVTKREWREWPHAGSTEPFAPTHETRSARPRPSMGAPIEVRSSPAVLHVENTRGAEYRTTPPPENTSPPDAVWQTAEHRPPTHVVHEFGAFGAALRRHVREAPVHTERPSQVPLRIPPGPPLRSHVVAQRLLVVVERAESACRQRVERPPKVPRPNAAAAAETTIESPRFDWPAQAEAGLRRLANLASAEPLPSIMPKRSPLAVRDDFVEREQRQFADEDFAALLAETLRAEAERDGVDAEGRIR
jgi:hypothetical protein